MRVAAAVLAGGASRRMGRDKALVEVGGIAMVDRVIGAALEAGASPCFVYGGDVDALSDVTAPFVADLYPGEGPVGGLLGALRHVATPAAAADAAASHLLVLACDLAFLDAPTLRRLIDEASGDAHSAVWVAATDRLEPMCALWSVDAVDEVAAAFERGERAMHRVIGELRHVAVTASDEALSNINTPGDLPG